MTKFVSYVPDETIEKDAQALLAEYAHARGVVTEAPIAIDDIIEKHLKIGIEFDDTHRLFGVPRSGIGFDPDILGAIFFEQKRIVIDESLISLKALDMICLTCTVDLRSNNIASNVGSADSVPSDCIASVMYIRLGS